MTLKLKTLLLLVIGVMAIIPMAQADWTTSTVYYDYDDGIMSEAGAKFFDGFYYVALKQTGVNHYAFFKFGSVNIPDNATIQNAYIQFTAPPGAENATGTPALDTIYGLKVADQPSWDPTPDLLSQPQTTAYTNFDVDTLVNRTQLNVTVTEIVQEMYNVYNWSNYKEIGFKVVSVADPVNRYALARESSNTEMAKLYVEYTTQPNGTVVYKGYVITPSSGGSASEAYSIIRDPYSGEQYILYPKTGKLSNDMNDRDAVMNVSIPYYFGGSSWLFENNVGFSFNDTIYIVARTTLLDTFLKVYSSPVTDLVNWTDRGTIINLVGSYVKGYDVEFDYTNHVIHVAGHRDNSMVYNNMSLPGYAVGSQTTIWSGFSATGEGGEDLIIGSDGSIWIAGSNSESSSSSKTVWIAYLDPNKIAWATYEIPQTSYQHYYPHLIEFGDYVHLVYYSTYTSGSKYYKWWNTPLSAGLNFTFRANPYTGTSEIGKIAQLYVHEEFFSPSHPYPDVAVIFTMFSAPHPDEMGYTYIHQQGVGNFSVVTGTDADGFANSSYNIWGINIWESEAGKYAYFMTRQNPTLAFANDRLGVPKVYTLPVWNSPFYPGQIQTYNLSYPGGTGFYHLTMRVGAPSTGGGFTVTINGTTVSNDCIANATTIEEVMACLDEIVGQDPQDPDPPGSNYPPDGPGALTRFNIRFYVWLIGWICIMGPIFRISMGNLPIQYYFGFAIMILTGIALLWSTATI